MKEEVAAAWSSVIPHPSEEAAVIGMGDVGCSPEPQAPTPVPGPSRHPCLGGDHLGHHVPGVDVDGTDGHDLHSVSRVEVSNEQGDECIQLADLWEQTCLPWTRLQRWPRAGTPGHSGTAPPPWIIKESLKMV